MSRFLSDTDSRAVLDALPAGVVVTDRAGRVLQVNPHFLSLFGYSEEEVLGRPVADLAPPASRPAEVLEAAQRLTTGDHVTVESWRYRRDGTPIAVAFFGGPWHADGEWVGCYGLFEDITDHWILSEEAVRAAALHRATLESTADGLLVVDTSGRSLSYNHRFLEMWGLPDDVVTRADDEEKLRLAARQVEDSAGFLARVRALYADPETASYDEIHLRDGRIFERYSQPQRVAGRSVGRVWSFRDVTAQRRAQAALEESQRLLELFFSQSLDGFFFMMLDEPIRWDDTVDKEAALDYVFAHQRITKVNDAMLAQYGAQRDGFLGLTPNDLYGHDIPGGRAVWRRFFDEGRLHVETDERTLDGRPIVIEGDYICLYDAERRIIGHFGIQRDVTEQRRAEAELRRSRQEFRALAARLQSIREDERTRIAREIHDELGQALTGLKIDLAWLGPRLRDRPELHERMQSALGQIDGTMAAVRRIATELRPSVLDHLGLAAAVEWQAQEFERRTGIAVALDVAPDELAVDDARATTVFRILQEALTNVARHAQAGAVRIALVADETVITLEVRDDGRGITDRELRNSRSLGLIGLRERAAACGGELTIQGVPDQGTTVTVQIPLAAARRSEEVI